MPWASALLDGALGVKWSAEIVAFMRANTQGLLILIVITLWFEYVGMSRPRELERDRADALERILDHTLRANTSQALVSHSLETIYGTHAAKALTKQLFSSSPVLREVDVTLRARALDTAEYAIEIELGYRAKCPRFLIAVTDTPFQMETLLSLGLFNEVCLVPPGTISSHTKASSLPIRVAAVVPNAKGGETYGTLAFSAVPHHRISHLLTERGIVLLPGPYHIFEQANTIGEQSTAAEARFIVTSTLTHPAHYPYMFWLSDRVLHVSSIEVDVSGLPTSAQQGLRIHFFVGSISWMEHLGKTTSRAHVPLNTWLVNGQGVAVLWPANAPAAIPSTPITGTSSGAR